QPQAVATIFLGGGTPSYLDPRQLGTLLANLRRWFPEQPGQEFSLEANPRSLDAEKLAILARYGVNRISLGVQSFQPHLLGTLERDHTPDDVRRVAELVNGAGLRLSLDLIFAVPGQTLGQWQADLDRALTLEPGHVSTYGLTYEKGTRLWKQRQA